MPDSTIQTEADAAVQPSEGAGALLNDVREAAVDTYYSARERTLDTARDVNQLAQRAAYETAGYVRRARSATGRFASVHALPLTAVGLGLVWLAVSVRNESRNRPTRRPLRARATLATRGVQTPSFDLPAERTSTVPRAASTTSGAKLMGVRARDLDSLDSSELDRGL